MRREHALLYALLSGVLFALAFPPIGLGFFAYFALIPMYMIMEKTPHGKKLFLYALFSGVVFHGLTLNWIRHITWIGMFFTVIVLSLFYTIPFVLTTYSSKITRDKLVFSFPFFLAAFEWIRSYGQLAFPWMIYGNSQTGYPWMIQFASMTSVYGVSFWVALVNASIFTLYKKRTPKYAAIVLLLFVVPIVHSLAVMSAGEEGQEVRVSLIQGNVPPEDKWSEELAEWNVNHYRTMSIEAMESHPDLIVWPETAVPVYLLERRYYRQMVHSLVDSIAVPVFTGLPSIDPHTWDTWNSAGLFIPEQREVVRYDKINLVPFGEAIPLNQYFPQLRNIDLGQANWMEGKETVVFEAAGLPPFSGAICFESIFPDLIRKFVVNGSQFIVVITNDVWFGPYASPAQHAMISVMRAVELRRPIVRCANTGISMLIDSYGRIIERTATFETVILNGTIISNDSMTFYAKFGNLFSFACVIISLTFIFAARAENFHSSKRNVKSE